MSKVIFITGVSSGLGEATARLFADSGWKVVGTVRKAEDAEKFSDRPNQRVLNLDVTDQEAVLGVADEAMAIFGRVDVVVNNAGYFQMGPLETSTMEQIRSQFETNVFGLIAVTKAFLPHLRDQGSGLFINIASASAENGCPFRSAYSASKGAVALLTEALNVELASVGLNAEAVFPGLHARRIFTKVDIAPSVPDGYLPLLQRFNRVQQSVRGSESDVAAEVVWRAVNDGRDDCVRYYAGPDASAIPGAKRLLGAAGYWRFFRKTLLNGPGALTRLLTRQGKAAMEFGDNPGKMQADASG